MAKKTSSNKTITIHVPITTVWQALTHPSMIKQFFFGVETKGDWKEGNAMFFKGEWQGKKFEGKGKVLQVKDQKMLCHSYWSNMSGLSDLPENFHIIHIACRLKMGIPN